MGLPSHSAVGMTDYMLLADINVAEPFVTNMSALNLSECCSGPISLYLLRPSNTTQQLFEHDVNISFPKSEGRLHCHVKHCLVISSGGCIITQHIYKMSRTPMSKGVIYSRTRVLGSGWPGLRAGLASSEAEDPKRVDTGIKLDNLSR